MRVRMQDIADAVGVSQTTVSHVLRGRGDEFRISPDTARHIRDTAARMGYHPSALARSLKERQAFTLALAVGDLANPFWAGLAVAAQNEADRHGYMLVVDHINEEREKEQQLLEMLRQKRVDGAILSPSHLDADDLAALRKEKRPFVLVDRTIDGFAAPAVLTDNKAGIQLAVDHLVSRGHARIAFLGGPTYISTFRERLLAFREAMKKRGIRGATEAISESEPGQARQAAIALLRERPAPTAIIAANFWLTVGTLRAASPDVEIVGFDDLYLADLLKRPVTTIAQPVEQLGREAVRLLLVEIASPGGRRRMVLPPRLIVR
jgi:LacI family transcriptional regulator